MSRLVITVDQRYWRTPDGALWTRMPPAYNFFAGHLSAWDQVRVIARVMDVPEPLPDVLRADGPSVEFVAVPGYAGPAAFVRHLPALIRSLRQAVGPEDTLLLRGPSNLANVVKLLFPHHDAAVEVLGDPWELYAPGAVRSPLRALYRRWFTWQLRWQCAEARVAGYVSQAVAERYPAAQTFRLLDIDLPAESFGTPRTGPAGRRVVSVGGFDHPVKGHDVLIRAIAQLPTPATLTIVGAGGMKPELQALAYREGVQLRFAGELAGAKAVRQVVAQADLFVLATRSEGMPRALIEAMALGVPAVATRVGGIPELLPASQLADRDCPAELAQTIEATLNDRARYADLSERGIRLARRYAGPLERDRRQQFLAAVRGGSKELAHAHG
jgi:phosphatidylinositol alpha-1,6-mannosyltransferase